MKRRQFITLLGGAAAALPLAARAQQAQKTRRIGVLMHLAADDPEGQRRVAAFLQGLQEAGLAVGRNVDIDVRWAGGEADRFPRYAAELIALGPDVILGSATPGARAVRPATRMVPIVFVLVPDAVGSGLVGSLSRPGGNATGFTMYEFSIAPNGWSCSNRSRPRSRGWRYFETQRIPPAWVSSAPSRALRHRSGWR